jgi:hypothetical protein
MTFFYFILTTFIFELNNYQPQGLGTLNGKQAKVYCSIKLK